MSLTAPVINDHALDDLGFSFLERSEAGHDVYISVRNGIVWNIEHLAGWGSKYQVFTDGKSRYCGEITDLYHLENLLELLSKFY